MVDNAIGRDVGAHTAQDIDNIFETININNKTRNDDEEQLNHILYHLFNSNRHKSY